MMGHGQAFLPAHMLGGCIIMMLLLFLILIGFTYFFLKQKKADEVVPSATIARQDPLEIAKFRLANGDLSVPEFEEIKKTLLEKG